MNKIIPKLFYVHWYFYLLINSLIKCCTHNNIRKQNQIHFFNDNERDYLSKNDFPGMA